MDEIIPHLWIGDLACALAPDYLAAAGVTHILSAMKQRLPPPPPLPDGRVIGAEHMHHVRIDDVEAAPMLVHLPSAVDWLRSVLQETWVDDDEPAQGSGGSSSSSAAGAGASGAWHPGENVVFVHCQAGVSRSVAIVLAYLMQTRDMDLSDALELVKSRRPQAGPNAGFMAQLELYQDAGCVVDVRHQSVRRFLMSQTSILNGDSIEDVLLAYYPSPFASPSLSKTSSASSVNGEQRRGSSSGASAARLQMSPVMSRATSRSDGSALDLSVSPPLPAGAPDLDADAPLFSSVSDPREVKITSNSGRLPGGVKLLRGNEGRHNAGTLPNPVFQGPKLRCKMCRRELAARDHVVEHEAGRGQGAFTARKRRKDIGEREREGRSVGSTAAELNTEQKFGARSRPVEEAQPAAAASTADGDDGSEPSASSSAPAEDAGSTGLKTAANLTASLPPALAALRMGASAASAAGVGGSRMIHSAACSAYYVEPLAWMENLRSGEVAGRLDCPNAKCGAKLGSWDWAGMQCGCGAWVTPAFSLHRSKVDEVG